MLTNFENDILCQLRKAAMSTPTAAPEPLEPPVCTLFERCSGCPYPAHGFIFLGRDESCMRQSMWKIQGINRWNILNETLFTILCALALIIRYFLLELI